MSERELNRSCGGIDKNGRMAWIMTFGSLQLALFVALLDKYVIVNVHYYFSKKRKHKRKVVFKHS